MVSTLYFVAFAILGGSAALAGNTAPPANVDEMVKKAIDREIHNQRKLANYTWETRSVTDMLSNSAELKKKEVRVHENFNIDGTSYRKLIEKDGKPLSASDARKEQEKMDKEIAKRKAESPSQRRKRQDAEKKELEEGIKFREEVMKAFTFRLEGQEKVNGFSAWRIAGDPRADFKPKSRDGKMLAKIRGRIWVEQASGEWLKFEVETLDKITFGAFLASVAPGAKISAQQMRVNEELWHPEWMRVRLNARALWKKINADMEQTYRNFRKFQTESRIVEVSEVEK
jgi:hypothetical protein